MGLIIGKKIPMLKKGYPTVSDKYNVSGAVLSGTTAVNFGDVVLKDTQTPEGCYFKAIGTTTITAASQLGGFVVATNVKVAQNYPGTTVQVNPGEAFNLLVSGFLAIEIDASLISSGTLTTVPAANGQVYITGAGVLTPVATSNVAVTGAVFTGLYEIQGSHVYAEIYVK